MFEEGYIVQDLQDPYRCKYLCSIDEYGNDMLLIDEGGSVVSKADNEFDLYDDIGIDYRRVVKVGKLKF